MQYPMYNASQNTGDMSSPTMYDQQYMQQQPYAYNVDVHQPNAMGIQFPRQSAQMSQSMLTPNMMYPHYKRGGHASLSDMANRVRQAGTDGDTILAHISPEEAEELALESGGPSFNPHTHLPSYRFKLKFPKFLKKAAQFVLPIGGGLIGGPLGAALGGGLGGVIGGGRHAFRNALLGAGLGFAGAGGLGSLGGLGEIIPNIGRATGLGSLLGGGRGGGRGQDGTFWGGGNVDQYGNTGGPSGGGLGSLLSNPLMLAGLATPLLGKKKTPHEPSNRELAQIPWRPDQYPRPIPPLERAVKELEELEEEGLNAPGNREVDYFKPVKKATGGYLDGHTSGQEDKIPAQLSDGEYVISADVVSHLGDGNNKAGAKKLDQLMVNVRKHRMKSGGKLPPKAKSLSAYMSKTGRM